MNIDWSAFMSFIYSLYDMGTEAIIATIGVPIFLAFIFGWYLKGRIKGFGSWLWMVIIFFLIVALVAWIIVSMVAPGVPEKTAYDMLLGGK